MNRTAISNSEISFAPLSKEHFSVIYARFNKPHVQAFYSLRAWTIEDVHQKAPYIQGAGDMKCYIVFMGEKPIGYIQGYPIKKHPWEGQNLSDDIVQNSAGIDLFIGEEDSVGEGLGCQRHLKIDHRL